MAVAVGRGIVSRIIGTIWEWNGGYEDNYRNQMVLYQKTIDQIIHDHKISNNILHDQIVHAKKIQEDLLQIIRDQRIHDQKIIVSQLTTINSQYLLNACLAGVVIVYVLVNLWNRYFSRFRNSYKGDHRGLPYGGTPCHCHMTGTTDGTSVQSQVFTRIEMMKNMVKNEGETFTRFLTRLRIEADDVDHDGRLSAKQKERAVKKALKNNLPVRCLSLISRKMTSDEIVKIADKNQEHQTASGVQCQDMEQEE